MNSDAVSLLPVLSFLAKKIISLLLYPVGMTLALLVASMVALLRNPRSRWGFGLVCAAALLLFVSSLPITAHMLLEPLELVAGDYCDPEMLSDKGVRHVVVLAGSLVLPDLSPGDRWGASLHRVMEGIRLATGLPQATLVLSGGCRPHIQSNPEAMAVLPIQLGVAPDKLLVKIGALDTADEALMISEIVGKEPFALVTSASHIQRAKRLFQQQGAHPVPCPCTRRVWRKGPWYTWILPSATSLKDTTEAIHEYLGLTWGHLKYKFLLTANSQVGSLNP